MPQGRSSTSSRENGDPRADAPADPEPTEGDRFQCPADFVPFSYKPCSSTLGCSDSSDTELWLIKAPAGFNPESFSGVQLPLCGLARVSIPLADGTERPYSVLGSSDHSPELRLLTLPTSLAPPFSGLISICESHGDQAGEQTPHVVRAVPPPSLPSGLKQRFQHFSAACARQAESPRKRKRERKIKSEPQEASECMDATVTETEIKTEVKREPLDMGFGEQPEVRKKKKKKKSKSAE